MLKEFPCYSTGITWLSGTAHMDLSCQTEIAILETSGLLYSQDRGTKLDQLFNISHIFQGLCGVSIAIGQAERQIIPDTKQWSRKKSKTKRWPSDSRLVMNVADPLEDTRMCNV